MPDIYLLVLFNKFAYHPYPTTCYCVSVTGRIKQRIRDILGVLLVPCTVIPRDPPKKCCFFIDNAYVYMRVPRRLENESGHGT